MPKTRIRVSDQDAPQCEFIDAREAERIGMVTRAVPPEQLAEETYKLPVIAARKAN